MSEIIKIDDYNYNLDLLIQQYKDKEKFKSILISENNQANEIESAMFEIRDKYYLNTATGVQLDTIGIIIGLRRAGRDDESYRTLLKIKAIINRGASTPEILILTAKALYNSTIVEYTPIYPAAIQLWSDGDIGIYLNFNFELDDGGLLILDDGEILIVQSPDEIAEDLLYQVLPAGVDLVLMDNLILDDNTFLYLDDDGHIIIIPE